MKWIGERISFVDNKDSLSFVIYPPKLGKKRILIVIWSILWLIVGGYVIYSLFKDYTKEEKLVLIIFLTFWLYFAIRVFRTLFYLFYGKEFIKLDKNVLRVKQAIWDYGKARQFFLENIAKLKVELPKENSIKKVYEDSPWVMGANRIEFEYFEKRYSFGRKLEEKDAEMVFKILTRRIEKFIKHKS